MFLVVVLCVVMATRLKVTLIGEKQATSFVVRHLQIDDLTSPGTLQRVIQLHFTSWPHHGVPEQCLPLLQVKNLALVSLSWSRIHYPVYPLMLLLVCD